MLVVSTSDRSSMERLKAAYTATAVAEYFRDQHKSVLLMMDSVTRFGRAQREIGLAAGEPPTRRGFPPSVFSTLPKLMERAGNSDKGSITALYTVLVEGGDMTEPHCGQKPAPSSTGTSSCPASWRRQTTIHRRTGRCCSGQRGRPPA